MRSIGSASADNTIVVFISDHGYLLGERGQWMKQMLFERSARAPLIVSAPGVSAKGRSSQRIVEFLDLYPTLAELAHLTPPPGLHGRSLVPLLRRPSATWDHPALTQVRRNPTEGNTVLGLRHPDGTVAIRRVGRRQARPRALRRAPRSARAPQSGRRPGACEGRRRHAAVAAARPRLRPPGGRFRGAIASVGLSPTGNAGRSFQVGQSRIAV